ncbi:MAG: hypothetical protein QNJ57_12695 [Flavobacteriaceae bacterium]|nr:hypothetical protein [Flavobacteriaceae bacterium]
MRSTIFLMMVLGTSLVYGQTEFIFNENGLDPKYAIANLDSTPATELYQKTRKWIENTSTNATLALDTEIENDFIHFTGIKDNAIKVGKGYLHMKYTVKVSFKKGLYKFEPLEILTKVNSKYDMGWKAIDLNNGSVFFKKGKAIKKTKSYVTSIPAVLNELNAKLYKYLRTR